MPEPRSEREFIRRLMNSMSFSGRYGDWVSGLGPQQRAKVYKLESEDSTRAGYKDDAARFLVEATKLWPEVVNWTGRKGDPLAAILPWEVLDEF